jgi:hypothetical protein
MRRLLRWYGANPLHLLALLGCFALAGYAAARLVPSRPLGVAVWFGGAVVGHDLLLVPLYSLADRSAMAAIRHRAPRLPAIGWINYLRVPAGLSALLLLVWFPLILRLHTRYQASTTLSPSPFLWHWLAVTGALFLLSAAAFAVRLRTAPRAVATSPRSPRPAVQPGGQRREHRRHDRDGDQDPGHLAGGGVSAQQPALSGDQMAGRVDPDDGLQPAGHGPRGDEDVAGQGEGEQHDGAGPHDRLRGARDEAEGGPGPGHAEREQHEQANPGEHPGRPAGRPVPDDQAEHGQSLRRPGRWSPR